MEDINSSTKHPSCRKEGGPPEPVPGPRNTSSKEECKLASILILICSPISHSHTIEPLLNLSQRRAQSSGHYSAVASFAWQSIKALFSPCPKTVSSTGQRPSLGDTRSLRRRRSQRLCHGEVGGARGSATVRSAQTQQGPRHPPGSVQGWMLQAASPSCQPLACPQRDTRGQESSRTHCIKFLFSHEVKVFP